MVNGKSVLLENTVKVVMKNIDNFANNLKDNYLKLVHVESGLRSFDKNMPEEINRIISDQVSNILLPPTNTAKKNLLKENIDRKKIFITGNTIVDVVKKNIKFLDKSKEFKVKDIKYKKYILVTLHRPETSEATGRCRPRRRHSSEWYS